MARHQGPSLFAQLLSAGAVIRQRRENPGTHECKKQKKSREIRFHISLLPQHAALSILSFWSGWTGFLPQGAVQPHSAQPASQLETQQEARFAAERGRNEREWRPDTRQLTVADVETLIACALAQERGTVIPVIRDALDELLSQEGEHHKGEAVA